MTAWIENVFPNPRLRGNLSGLLAIILWSTTVAFARSLSEQLGPLTGAASVYSVGGLASLFLLKNKFKQIRRLPKNYLFGCGALFTFYMLVLFLAVGVADSREQVLEVGLLNYLWPSLTIVFSLFFLKKKAGFFLIPGTLLALTGEFLVLTQNAEISWQSFLHNLADNPAAYSFGLSAAVSWALYSNLTRRWAGSEKTGAVELFLPVTGVILLIACFFTNEPQTWNLRAIAEAIFLGICTLLAYSFWDTAMRQGDIVLVAACSYLTPFFSTLVSCMYLQIVAGISVWIGCALIVGGSLLSWKSVRETDSEGLPE